MKALVRTSKEAGGFTCMDMPKPAPAADQVLIRVKALQTNRKGAKSLGR